MADIIGSSRQAVQSPDRRTRSCPVAERVDFLRRTTRILLALLATVSLTATLAPAAHSAWMLPPAPYRAKDFCIVKAPDGLYHVFYIRTNTLVAQWQTEMSLGHAVTPNFWTWYQLDSVLTIRPGNWDNLHVWAPSIVTMDSVYYMFYTGVTYIPGLYNQFQRIGVATSTDLMTWNRMDTPLLSCDDTPWAFCDSMSLANSTRDGFVMSDPAQPGHWLMYYASRLASDSNMVVGLARSSGDLTQWVDDRPLMSTEYAMSGAKTTESPHVFQFDGYWYLFYTTELVQSLQFQTASDPTADSPGWTPRGGLGDMLGLNTAAWYASEHLRDGLIDLFAFVEWDRLTFYRMIGTPGDWHFSLAQPDRFRVMGMSLGADTARVGQVVPLTFRTVEGTGQLANIQVMLQNADGSQTAVVPDSAGLPTAVPMTADTTVFPWTVRESFLSPTDTARVHQVVVRMADQTAATAPITLLRDTLQTPPPPPPPPPPPLPLPDEPGSNDTGLIRVLHYSPFGTPALLVHLPAAAQARVDLFDLQGRRVCNLADRVLPRGATVLAWDGRDAGGARARAGVYFARLMSGRTNLTVRVVLTP